MNLLKKIIGVTLVAGMVACGGGGGNPGSTTNGSSSTSGSGSTGTGSTVSSSTVTLAPSIKVSIVDAAGNNVASNSIAGGSIFYAQAEVKNSDGSPVGNKLVNFTVPASVATLASPSVLTDTSTGIGKVQISPVSLTAASAGNLVASTTVNAVPISGDLDFQTSAANISLTTMVVAQSSISALQSTAVSVGGRINGAPAGSGLVTATFTASCGSFSPSTATTNGAGAVNTTYQSSVGCSGPVTLTAQATGSAAVSAVVNVLAAQAANIVFNSATVPLMVTSAAPSGLKQSAIRFQVLNNAGTGMPSETVGLSLASQAISAGVTFSVGGVSSTATQFVPADSSGFVTVTVSSGSLPTPVVVTAKLVSNPLVIAASSGVAVTSGVPSQDKASLSVDKFSLEALNTDGVQAILTIRVADRLSNPIQPGSIVNFVASHGLVQGSCSIDAASLCTVTYTSQGMRPANGRVSVLAYMDGEESFVDQNGDNIWQPGEPFSDVGQLYLDANENGLFEASTEQTIPGGLVGSASCSSLQFSYPSIANSCDGVWSSSIRIRRQITLTLASSEASMVAITARSVDGFIVLIGDLNGNSMPTGTTLSATVSKSDTTPAACTVSSVSPNKVRNSSNSGQHQIFLNGESTCLTAKVDVTVITPAGVATTFKF